MPELRAGSTPRHASSNSPDVKVSTLAPLQLGPHSLSDVVVVFASNDHFCPYFSVALQSLVEHCSPDRRYDVVVLGNAISPVHAQQLELQAQIPGMDIHLHLVDVARALAGVELPTHGHFRREMYYRLLAPELLAGADKAVYLDSDVVVERDVADLFDVELGDALLGATQDADTVGQACGYNQLVAPYLRDVLKIDDPRDYFQSGVLLMNLAGLRRTYPTSEIVALAASRHWHWPDQDVLNILARNKWKRVDMAWNTLSDWRHMRRSKIVAQAPKDVRDAYDTARSHPFIIHYAGPDDRPWNYPDMDMADRFWDYASRSPMEPELLARLEASRTTARGRLKRLQVEALYRFWMPLFDALFHPGTRLRIAALHVIRVFSFHVV